MTEVGLAQSVERLIVEREVAGSIPGAGPIFIVWLRWPRKMAVPSPVGDAKIMSPIGTFVLNTLEIKSIFFGWLQKPVNTAASHHSPSFGRLSPPREKHYFWPHSQAKLQQQFLTQKVLVHLRLQSTISSPVNGRKIVPSKPYSYLLKSSLSRMDENIKLLQPSRKKFTKVPKNKDMQFLTSRFRWLSGTFKILTFSLSESTTSLLQNRFGNFRHLWISDI